MPNVNDDENIYVAGVRHDNVSSSDIIIIKYRANGDTAWVRTYNGDYQDYGNCIAGDSSGNIYVGGSS